MSAIWNSRHHPLFLFVVVYVAKCCVQERLVSTTAETQLALATLLGHVATQLTGDALLSLLAGLHKAVLASSDRVRTSQMNSGCEWWNVECIV